MTKPESQTTQCCATCKHWRQPDYQGEKGKLAGVKECARIHPLWEAAKWIRDAKDGEGDYQLTEDGKQSSAFVQDGSEYMAILFTKPDFSCKLWEEIPNA
jgi:hypothetical protein